MGMLRRVLPVLPVPLNTVNVRKVGEWLIYRGVWRR